MDSFELNKIIGAILGTLLFVMGIGFLAEGIYHPIEDRGPGYALPEPEAGATGEATAEAAPAVPLGVLLASADASRGQTAVRKCQSCHNFEQGAGNKQGPELYGVVGRVIGSHEGFAYSEAMLAHQAAGDVWSYENLDHFLASPKGFVAGTKMNFGGVKSPEERADILAYLQTLSPSPVAFPAAEAAAPAAAAGDGTTPPAESTAPEAGDASQASAPATNAMPAAADAAVETAPAAGAATDAAPAEGAATEAAPN